MLGTLLYYLINFLTFGLYHQYLLSGATLHFQKPGTLTFDRIIDFHDFIMIYLFFVFVLFVWVLVWSVNIYPFLYYLFFPLFFFTLIEMFLFFLWNVVNDSVVDLKQLRLGELYRVFISELYFYIFKRRMHKPPLPESLFELKFIVSSIFNLISHEFLLLTRRATHAPKLEIVWTIFPSFILLAIAIPSLYLLYMLDAVEPLSLAVKVIGHQWYWSYEIGNSSPLFHSISNLSTTSFDSYMLSNETSNIRLLEVDNVLFVPAGVPLTFLITSTDVIHSWAVPSLGIKVDAIPGRLNQVCVTVFDINVYYGQCSELCGVNHGFMPVNVVSLVDKVRL
jgi:cytochrome c oxidase subunit 2